MWLARKVDNTSTPLTSLEKCAYKSDYNYYFHYYSHYSQLCKALNSKGAMAMENPFQTNIFCSLLWCWFYIVLAAAILAAHPVSPGKRIDGDHLTFSLILIVVVVEDKSFFLRFSFSFLASILLIKSSLTVKLTLH